MDDFIAFDELPPKLRTLLCFSLAKHDSREVAQVLAEMQDEEAVVQVIINTDIQMVVKDGGDAESAINGYNWPQRRRR